MVRVGMAVALTAASINAAGALSILGIFRARRAAMADLPADFPVAVGHIRAAHKRIRGLVHETPVTTSRCLDEMLNSDGGDRRLFFKCEVLQRTGSFKVRGALNAACLAPEGAPLVTHSSGNHAQAIALAAKLTNRKAYVVMPNTAPAVKVAAVRSYGAEITFCEPTDAARASTAEALCKEKGGFFVHPSNEPNVIAGQGTVGLEMMRQVRDLDCLVVPVGGGGLLSGIAIAAKAANPRITIVAAEPLGANDAYRSKKSGQLEGHSDGGPLTEADGLKTTLGSNTWPVVRDVVDDILLVSEADILEKLALVWERLKLCIEPSAAVGVAAVLSDDFRERHGAHRRIGVVLCGGNVDVPRVAKLMGSAAGGEGP